MNAVLINVNTVYGDASRNRQVLATVEFCEISNAETGNFVSIRELRARFPSLLVESRRELTCYYAACARNSISDYIIVKHSLALIFTALGGLFVVARADTINLDTGLIAHLALNGNAHDLTGHGNDGTVIGELSWAEDRFGNANGALKLDRNGYVEISNTALLNGATSGAITGWFNSRLEANEEGFVIGAGDSRSGLDPFVLFLTGSKVTQSLFSETTKGQGDPTRYIGFDTPSQVVSIAASQWTPFVMQFASIGGLSIFQFYLDGELKREYVNPFFFEISYDQPMPVQIGALTGFQDVQFRGEIDDIRFYSRALNFSEIKALSTQSVPEAGLTALYLMFGIIALLSVRRTRLNR